MGSTCDAHTVKIYGDNLWTHEAPNIKASKTLAHETKHAFEKKNTNRIDRYCRYLSLGLPIALVSARTAYLGSELGGGMVAAVGAVGGVIICGVLEAEMLLLGALNYISPLEYRARRYAAKHSEEYAGIISMQKKDS